MALGAKQTVKLVREGPNDGMRPGQVSWSGTELPHPPTNAGGKKRAAGQYAAVPPIMPCSVRCGGRVGGGGAQNLG